MDNDGSLGVLLAGLVVTVALTAFFLSAVCAIARSRLSRLNELADQRIFGSTRAVIVLEHREYYLLAAQFGLTVAAAVTGFFAARVPSTPALIHIAQQHLPTWPLWPLLFGLLVLLAACVTIFFRAHYQGLVGSRQ